MRGQCGLQSNRRGSNPRVTTQTKTRRGRNVEGEDEAALGAAATAAVLAVSTATVASATTTQGFGSQERLNEANGAVVTGYTVSGIMPSSDVIPYPVSGRLYESTLTVDAVQGSVTPLIPLFNARAQNGDTYRVLANVATPQGVSPATLQQGGRSTGKIYFDVATRSSVPCTTSAPPRGLAVH